jgi:metal-responsive CopG/Arc/MetJ family transcriptional regulator
MRVKTSISLSKELLKQIDRVDSNRSNFFERAARSYLTGIEKKRRDARDASILDAQAERLNAEALDVLGYQELK